MSNPTPLSPAAHAVWDAAWNLSPVNCESHEDRRRQQIAAALRVAAAQVAPDDYDPPRGVNYPEKDAFIDGKCVRNEDIRDHLLAIAAELDP